MPLKNKHIRVAAINIFSDEQLEMFTQQEMDRRRILDDINIDEDIDSGKRKLQSEYEVHGLSFGDRLRVMDKNKELYDIIEMPDGSLAIQDLELSVSYGQTRKFNSWEEVEETLGDVTVETGIKS